VTLRPRPVPEVGLAHPQVLRDMALFVEVAKRKSFSQAAAALDVPISSLSRRITQFEATIGLRLLDRTTRKLVLTPYGEAYYEQALRLVEEAQRSFDELIAQARGPSGLLRIAAPPDGWAFDHLPAVVAGFMSEHEHVRVHLDLRPAVADLAAEGYDLALVTDEPREASMIARRVGRLATGVFGAPDGLARTGMPTLPEDLARHAAVVAGQTSVQASWRLSRAGETRTVAVSGAVSCNSPPLARRFALDGRGLALLPLLDAEADLRAGALVRVLPDWSGPPLPVSIVTTSRLMPAKARAFIEFAARQLGASLMPGTPEAPDASPVYALRA
jgi:DNA-binding transcriptional LysR family regulator